MKISVFNWRLKLIPWLALGCLTALSGCATAPTAATGHAYRVAWTATRASDHALLRSASLAVRLSSSASERTDSTRPTEEAPAFPSFAASLSPTKTAGVYELVVRAAVRETRRTKKGKLKTTKRNIGALLPIRPGETLTASGTDDPIKLDVTLERE